MPASRRVRPKIRKSRYPSGSLSWCVSWYAGGSRQRKHFPTRDAARNYASTLSDGLDKALQTFASADIYEIAAAILSARKQRETKRCDILWPAWVKTYLDTADRSPRHKASLAQVAKVTPWQRSKLDSITPQDVEAFVRKPKWSLTTQRNRLFDLSEIFGAAVKKSHLETNPCKGIQMDRPKPVPIEVFTPEETRRILDIVAAEWPRFLPVYAIGFFAGLRPFSELEILDWSDIQLDDGLMACCRKSFDTEGEAEGS